MSDQGDVVAAPGRFPASRADNFAFSVLNRQKPKRFAWVLGGTEELLIDAWRIQARRDPVKASDPSH
jgi:hypothetical protein